MGVPGAICWFCSPLDRAWLLGRPGAVEWRDHTQLPGAKLWKVPLVPGQPGRTQWVQRRAGAVILANVVSPLPGKEQEKAQGCQPAYQDDGHQADRPNPGDQLPAQPG